MRSSLLVIALLLGASSFTAPPSPAAIFVTWDGDPTTTVSVDWHLPAGADIESAEIRGPGIPRWSARAGHPVPVPTLDP